jgi:FAD/FMN-containing dehydrogenase
MMMSYHGNAWGYGQGGSKPGGVVDATASEEFSVARLRAKFKGQVIAPGDAGYDQARAVFFKGIDARPAVIVRAEDEMDVARAIWSARANGMELSVRSGGHSLAGHGVSDGGIVLDLSAMRALQIDVERRIAWAQTGLTAGEYTAAVGVHGLATGFGDTGSVGIGGLTLGGGIGYLVRKHGLTIDSLLAADIVTADGLLLHVDAETHPDLFWAIRGGGGNFGVATRFKFRLHEVDTIVGGMLILPGTPGVIKSFVAAADSAPEELSTIANVMLAPPLPFLPAEYHRRPVMMAMLAYAGDVEAGQRAIAPFRSLAPIADMVRPMTYADLYRQEGGFHPVLGVARSLFVDEIDAYMAEAIVDHLQTSPAPLAGVQLRVLGGAVARIPVEATAFAHRQRRILINVAAAYECAEDRPAHEAWVSDLATMLPGAGPSRDTGPEGHSGAYVNFMGDEGEAGVRAAYPGATWERLVAVKSHYDPENLFHRNQNIRPANHSWEQ